MDTFEVPNLDAQSVTDIARLEYVFRDLADYASHKRQAMRCRLSGEIDRALVEEKICDGIYKRRLPEWARW